MAGGGGPCFPALGVYLLPPPLVVIVHGHVEVPDRREGLLWLGEGLVVLVDRLVVVIVQFVGMLVLLSVRAGNPFAFS